MTSSPVLFRRRAASFAALLALALTAPVFAAPPSPPAAPPAPPAIVMPAAKAPFAYSASVRGTDGKILALQTAIRRFDPVSGNGPTVYLVAADHIGEKTYYHKLQEFLNKQDVVLYEGVRMSGSAKPTAAPAGGAAKPSPAPDFTRMQQDLATTLNLYFQFTAIDYRQPNFRNSDLSGDDLKQLAKAEGGATSANLDDFLSALGGGGATGKMMTGVLAQARSDPAFAKTFRSMLVEILANPKQIAAMTEKEGLGDPKLDSILIAGRNKAVLADLKALLGTKTKPLHSVALFYGAAHMEDMEAHLVADMGYRPVGADWLTSMTVVP